MRPRPSSLRRSRRSGRSTTSPACLPRRSFVDASLLSSDQNYCTLHDGLPHRFRRIPTVRRQPWIALRVETCIIRIEVDETSLNQEVAHLEHIAPAATVRHARPPWPGLMLAEARA